MAKRKLRTVPAALHSELSEYSSLLRALRTNDTLDLASQLLRTQPATSTSNEDPSVDLEQAVPSPNNLESYSGSQSLAKRKNLDNWTRWPLLTDDIHVPEFGFQDEVKALAMQALKTQQDSSDMEDLDEETVLPHHLSDTITLAVSSHLSRTLAALAAHTPPAEKSMQNRLKPFGWKSVLEIVAVSGLADPKVIEDVKQRMELMYGSSESHSVSRAQSKVAARADFQALCTTHEFSFLDFPEPQLQTPVLRKRIRRNRTIKEETKETETEDEDDHEDLDGDEAQS